MLLKLTTSHAIFSVSLVPADGCARTLHPMCVGTWTTLHRRLRLYRYLREFLHRSSPKEHFPQSRLIARSSRDKRVAHPHALWGLLDTVPVVAMKNSAIDCVCLKFVRAAVNKVRCPIFSTVVRFYLLISSHAFSHSGHLRANALSPARQQANLHYGMALCSTSRRFCRFCPNYSSSKARSLSLRRTTRPYARCTGRTMTRGSCRLITTVTSSTGSRI